MLEHLIKFQKHFIQILKQKLNFNEIFLFSVPKDYYKYPFILVNMKNFKNFPSYLANLYQLQFVLSVEFKNYGKNLFIVEKILNILLAQKLLLSSDKVKILYSNHQNTSILDEKIILDFNLLMQIF